MTGVQTCALPIYILTYCKTKFDTISVKSSLGASGWWNGSGQLWTGTMEFFTENYSSFGSIFTLDGGDSAPLCVDWINKLQQEHAITSGAGKLITGKICFNNNMAYVNGNMVLDLSIWDKYPNLHSIPISTQESSCDIWEGYHKSTFLSEVRDPGFLCNEWKANGITKDILADKAKSAIWLHGYKDENLVDAARSFLLE